MKSQKIFSRKCQEASGREDTRRRAISDSGISTRARCSSKSRSTGTFIPSGNMFPRGSVRDIPQSSFSNRNFNFFPGPDRWMRNESSSHRTTGGHSKRKTSEKRHLPAPSPGASQRDVETSEDLRSDQAPDLAQHLSSAAVLPGSADRQRRAVRMPQLTSRDEERHCRADREGRCSCKEFYPHHAC